MVCVVVGVRQLLALAVVGCRLRARERVDFLSPGNAKSRPRPGKTRRLCGHPMPVVNIGDRSIVPLDSPSVCVLVTAAGEQGQRAYSGEWVRHGTGTRMSPTSAPAR
jgi:hypothetical protein